MTLKELYAMNATWHPGMKLLVLCGFSNEGTYEVERLVRIYGQKTVTWFGIDFVGLV